MIMQIQISIDLSNRQQVNAMNAFNTAMLEAVKKTAFDILQRDKANYSTDEATTDEAPEEKAVVNIFEKAPAKRTRTTKKVEDIEVKDAEVLEPASEEPASEEPASEEPTSEEPASEEPTSEDTPAFTITQIRALLAIKVGDAREEIKAELEKLGAKNVTSLKEEKYNSFYNFLEAL